VKFQPLLALGLTILAASTQAFAGATLDRIEQKKELVGVLMESYPPFSMIKTSSTVSTSTWPRPWRTNWASSCASKRRPGT
jgi:hypothetical protein